LFVLLETGQSTFLRKSAAFQIGQVVKTHPNELGHLLEKVNCYFLRKKKSKIENLFSKFSKLKTLVTNSNWETRIAASQTVEAIVKNLNDEDLILLPGI
jgi:TATA-binding protein-associated factor